MDINQKTLKIALCFHAYPNNKLENYLTEHQDVVVPILGGSTTNHIKTDSWVKEHCLFDDSGENISNLNKNINEMTVIYWVWKHYGEIGNPDYIGLNHYRRFFVLDDVKNSINDNVDIICKNEETFDISMNDQYAKCHNYDDLLKLYDYLKINHNNNEHDWYTIFLKAMNSNRFIGNNMFVMRKELFFDYCNFMFPIIFDIIPMINLNGRDDYQKRAVGFLSERLTSAFIFNAINKHNFRKLPIIFEK